MNWMTEAVGPTVGVSLSQSGLESERVLRPTSALYKGASGSDSDSRSQRGSESSKGDTFASCECESASLSPVEVLNPGHQPISTTEPSPVPGLGGNHVTQRINIEPIGYESRWRSAESHGNSLSWNGVSRRYPVDWADIAAELPELASGSATSDPVPVPVPPGVTAGHAEHALEAPSGPRHSTFSGSASTDTGRPENAAQRVRNRVLAAVDASYIRAARKRRR
jgi:hypothetical protein